MTILLVIILISLVVIFAFILPAAITVIHPYGDGSRTGRVLFWLGYSVFFAEVVPIFVLIVWLGFAGEIQNTNEVDSVVRKYLGFGTSTIIAFGLLIAALGDYIAQVGFPNKTTRQGVYYAAMAMLPLGELMYRDYSRITVPDWQEVCLGLVISGGILLAAASLKDAEWRHSGSMQP